MCMYVHACGDTCGGGGVPSQIAFFTFGPKKVPVFCSCNSQGKNFPVFTLESDRLCLDQ